jgi:hypothetical protein
VGLNLKVSGLISLVEEISKQTSIQGEAWLLLAAFTQFYSENWLAQTRQKDL